MVDCSSITYKQFELFVVHDDLENKDDGDSMMEYECMYVHHLGSTGEGSKAPSVTALLRNEVEDAS